MMIDLGLEQTDMQRLFDLLVSPHRIRIQLELTNLDHALIGDISYAFLGGEVTVDSEAEIQRQMNLELFDFGRHIALDPDDPQKGSAYPTRMIRCTYHVGTMSGDKWYAIPLFMGPVTKVDRNGAILTVECSGKEVLSNGTMWSAINGYSGWNKIQLALHLMRNIGGEQWFDNMTHSGVTAGAQAVARADMSLYGYVRTLMNGIGLQTFYNARGYMRIRQRPNIPVYIFDEKSLMDDPQLGYSLENIVNAAEVTGATPSGRKTPLSSKRVAPADHPLSPQNLVRGGVPQYRPVIEENTDLVTQYQVDARAQELVNEGLLQSVEVLVPTTVNPLLEEDDFVTFKTDYFMANQRIKKFNIPLLATTPQMSVGYTLNVKPSKLATALRRP